MNDRRRLVSDAEARLRAWLGRSWGFIQPGDTARAVATFAESHHATKAAAPDDLRRLAANYLGALGVGPARAEGTSLLADLYAESYVHGVAGARDAIGVPIDFVLDNWRAVAQLLGTDGGRGLRGLLDDAAVRIKSIADSMLTDAARVLADGVAAGDPVEAIAKALDGVVDDPDRAGLVANTEVNRAMSAASLDEYRANGIEAKEWLVSDAPCDVCEGNGADGAIAVGESFASGDDAPPAHPGCTCSVAPVVDGGTGGTDDTAKMATAEVDRLRAEARKFAALAGTTLEPATSRSFLHEAYKLRVEADRVEREVLLA